MNNHWQQRRRRSRDARDRRRPPASPHVPMHPNGPAGTVQRMFAAFRAGDLDAVLATVNADRRWTYVGANPKPTEGVPCRQRRVRRFLS
jgi:hypothetical protein